MAPDAPATVVSEVPLDEPVKKTEMDKQVEAGMKLFKAEQELEVDKAGAEAHKQQVDEKIAAMEEEVKKLSGKDNKKERAAKSKEIADLKVDKQYIDACKVVKGLEPKSGFFCVVKNNAPEPEPVKEAVPEPVAPPTETEVDAKDKKEKKEKVRKQESAGLSPAETKELETLKSDIIARKAQLKAEGMSGGQQNKDSQVAAWVTRMNELKEKQDPGSTQKVEKKESKRSSRTLSADEAKQMEELKHEIDDYRLRLKTEFGYGNKDIKADPDLIEMEAKLADFTKRNK